jgi:hypothetical protein
MLVKKKRKSGYGDPCLEGPPAKTAHLFSASVFRKRLKGEDAITGLSLLVFGRCLIRISVGKSVILTFGFSLFASVPPDKCRIIPGLGHESRHLLVGLQKLKWKNEGTIPSINTKN